MRGLDFGAGALATAAPIGLAGCTGSTETITVGEGEPDIESARQFDRYPLYWVGEHFEGRDLESVNVKAARSDARGHRRKAAVFRYGTCELQVRDDGGCGVPLVIEIEPMCARLAAVESGRRIRGAPLNFNYGGTPLLYTDRVRITVYTGEGATHGMALRALRALRSANDVPPVIDADDRLPAPRRKARKPCPR
jgi:hypothetical protein